jgi:hypothetical protein
MVYLAHQVRQNTTSLRTENYARALDRLSTRPEEPELGRRSSTASWWWARSIRRHSPARTGCGSPGTSTSCVGAAEFVFHQAEQGALPEEVWDRWKATIEWWLSNPGIQTWWRSKPTPFSSSFESFCEEVIRSSPYDPDAAKRWEDFITGQRLVRKDATGP